MKMLKKLSYKIALAARFDADHKDVNGKYGK